MGHPPLVSSPAKPSTESPPPVHEPHQYFLEPSDVVNANIGFAKSALADLGFSLYPFPLLITATKMYYSAGIADYVRFCAEFPMDRDCVERTPGLSIGRGVPKIRSLVRNFLVALPAATYHEELLDSLLQVCCH